MNIRERYQKARADAGENFVAENPGKHFFFEDGSLTVCVFCGRTKAGAEGMAAEGQEIAPCAGDLRAAQRR